MYCGPAGAAVGSQNPSSHTCYLGPRRSDPCPTLEQTEYLQPFRRDITKREIITGTMLYGSGWSPNSICDVKRGHDEEIQDAVLENRPHQSGHVRLAMVAFELQDGGDGANESDQLCEDVRYLHTRETGGLHASERNLCPVRPLCSRRGGEDTLETS